MREGKRAVFRFLLALSMLILYQLVASAQTMNVAHIDNNNDESFKSSGPGQDLNINKLNTEKDLRHQLPALDSLIEIAAYNNPSLKAQQYLIESGEEQLKFAKREWQNGISGFFTQSVGNQTLFYDTNQEPAGFQTQSLTTGYRLGVNINLPLFLFSGRNSRINTFRNELDVKRQQKEQVKQHLSRQVTEEYNNLLASQKLLLIASSARSNARLLLDMADKQFSQGDMSIADYSSVSGVASKAESDYENARRDFYNNFLKFEQLIGVKIETLIK